MHSFLLPWPYLSLYVREPFNSSFMIYFCRRLNDMIQHITDTYATVAQINVHIPVDNWLTRVFWSPTYTGAYTSE